MDLLVQSLPFLTKGLLVTLELAFATLACASVISLALGTFGSIENKTCHFVYRCYVEFFRDIPLIVNVLFVFFAAPLLGLSLDPFLSTVVSLSLWGGANGAEIVRAGIASVPRALKEAGLALGLRTWQVFVFIIAPQAIRPIIPAFAGLMTLLVQATSLGALVGSPELLRSAQIVIERTTISTGESPAFLIYGSVLIAYFVICTALTLLTRKLEARVGGMPGGVRRAGWFGNVRSGALGQPRAGEL